MDPTREIQDRKKASDSGVSTQWKTFTALMVCGLGVGWLIGLSISPVVAVAVTAVMTVVVGLAGALAGLEQPHADGQRPSLRSQSLNPTPLMVLVIGIVAGSGLGITARANAWLSPTVDQVAKRWNGIDRGEISRRLFDQLYPPPTTNASGTEPKPYLTATALFAASEDECDRFRSKQGEDLRTELRSSVTSPAAKRFAEAVQDPAALKAAVEIFICTK
jgi:hypothetical protein